MFGDSARANTPRRSPDPRSLSPLTTSHAQKSNKLPFLFIQRERKKKKVKHCGHIGTENSNMILVASVSPSVTGKPVVGEVEGGYFIRVPIKLHWGFLVEEGLEEGGERPLEI